MGFLSALFGKKQSTNVEEVADHIWMSTSAKMTGVAREFEARSRTGATSFFLVAHFPDMLRQLRKIADDHASISVDVILAHDLESKIAALRVDPTSWLELIVAERHPLPSVDQTLKQVLEGQPCRIRLCHHLSLDDPLMRVFAGDTVRSLLSKMGMTENEAIESEMVTRRVQQAQKKIAAATLTNSTADSASEWLRSNCPEMTVD